MSRTRLPIILHLSPADIFRRYRACRRGVEKTHWHLIWLLTRPEHPLAPAQAAVAVGLSAVWARANSPAARVMFRSSRSTGTVLPSRRAAASVSRVPYSPPVVGAPPR